MFSKSSESVRLVSSPFEMFPKEEMTFLEKRLKRHSRVVQTTIPITDVINFPTPLKCLL